MLTGEYRHAVDTKKRLFIPAKHREELGPAFVIVRDIRAPRLKVYSKEGWAAYVEPIEKMPRKDSEAIMRFLHKDAVEGDPDAQGRVLLNKELLAYAGIEKDAVIVGCGEYAEIWSAEAYDKEMASEDVDALRDALERLGL